VGPADETRELLPISVVELRVLEYPKSSNRPRSPLAASTGSPRANIRGTSAPSQKDGCLAFETFASRAAVITLVKKHPTYRLTGVIEPSNVCY
jgi:hypothetical protein